MDESLIVLAQAVALVPALTAFGSFVPGGRFEQERSWVVYWLSAASPPGKDARSFAVVTAKIAEFLVRADLERGDSKS